MKNIHLECINSGRLLFAWFLGLFPLSVVGAESDAQAIPKAEEALRAESSYPVPVYEALKATREILADCDDAWMLEHVDSECLDEECFLRFHFRTEGEEPLTLHARLDPATGDLLSVEKMDRTKMEKVAVSPADELGNVAVLELFLSDIEGYKDNEGEYFRDLTVERKERSYFAERSSSVLKRTPADKLMVVRRRKVHIPLKFGRGAVSVVYDAMSGEVIVINLGDLLREPPKRNKTLEEELREREREKAATSSPKDP